LKRSASLRGHELLFRTFIFEKRCKLKKPQPSLLKLHFWRELQA
jgi:hypothetical protein